MRAYRLAITILAVCLVGATIQTLVASPASTRVTTARKALQRADPRGVSWEHVRSLDINCDSRADEVFIASDQYRFYVAVVLAPLTRASQYSVVAFTLKANHQSGLCGKFDSLLPEALRDDLIEIIGDEPLGYRSSTTCKGLRLTSGDCDSFHLYWNHMANALDWWRL